MHKFGSLQQPVVGFSRNSAFVRPTSAFLDGRGARGVPKWFGRLIYTIDGKKKPPMKFRNSYLPSSKIGQKYLKNT